MQLELLESEVSPPRFENSLLQTEQQTSEQSEKNLKCVPVDTNLKYHKISHKDLEEPSQLDDKFGEISEGLHEEMKKLLKDLKREREKKSKKMNDFPITTNLLYIEKCSEIR
jgi:hypothetical protein